MDLSRIDARLLSRPGATKTLHMALPLGGYDVAHGELGDDEQEGSHARKLDTRSR